MTTSTLDNNMLTVTTVNGVTPTPSTASHRKSPNMSLRSRRTSFEGTPHMINGDKRSHLSGPIRVHGGHGRSLGHHNHHHSQNAYYSPQLARHHSCKTAGPRFNDDHGLMLNGGGGGRIHPAANHRNNNYQQNHHNVSILFSVNIICIMY